MTFEEAEKKLGETYKALNDRYAGKQAIITSDYNGQDYGRSKKSMKGKQVVIKYVCFIDSNISVFIEGQLQSLRTDELRIL